MDSSFRWNDDRVQGVMAWVLAFAAM